MIPTKDRRREGSRRRFGAERTEGNAGPRRLEGCVPDPGPSPPGVGRYSSSFFAAAMMALAASAGTGSYPTNFREWWALPCVMDRRAAAYL